MAPYTILPRDDDSSAAVTDSTTDSATATATDAELVSATSTSSAASSTSSDSSDSSGGTSWVSTHKEDVYVGLAVAAGLLLLLLLILWKKNRLSFWPFRQKRCSGPVSCGKGISGSAKKDEEYYENGSGGWRCRSCQEKVEQEEMDKEMEMEDSVGDEMELKDASRGKPRSRNGRARYEEEDGDGEEEEHQVGRKSTAKAGMGRQAGDSKVSASRTVAGQGDKDRSARSTRGTDSSARVNESSQKASTVRQKAETQRRPPPRNKRDDYSDDDSD